MQEQSKVTDHVEGELRMVAREEALNPAPPELPTAPVGSPRHEFFVFRLRELGMYDADSDYGGLIGQWVEELSLAFTGQGHSGSSAAITLELFHQLMREWEGR